MQPDAGNATIFGVATPPGTGGVAVIRVSGPEVETVLRIMMQGALPVPRRAVLRRLVGSDGELLDEALVLRFEAGSSFTGEPVAEFHCHGGRAVVRAVLERLSGIEGCRVADAGEFTRRALLNGRLNLAEVEALGDLISSTTDAQRRLATRALAGGRASKGRDLAGAPCRGLCPDRSHDRLGGRGDTDRRSPGSGSDRRHVDL